MKIALINGSPRQKNSSEVIEYIKTNFGEQKFETFNLGKISMNYCIDCGGCKDGKCIAHKDELNDALLKIANCDGVVMISPVYFGGMTAQLKTLIDRTRPLRRNGFMLKNKVGAAISLGGSRNGGQEIVVSQIHAAMHINAMIIVGDNAHFGGRVHSPFSSDEIGKKTVHGTIEKVIETINLIKKI